MRSPSVLLAVCLTILTGGTALAQTIDLLSVPSTVGAGLQGGTSRARLSTGAHGGVVVTISPSDSTVALVARNSDEVGASTIDVFVPNGSTDATFVVQGLEGITGRIAFEASSPGFASAVDSVDVVTPSLDISGLFASTNVPSVPDNFQVRVGVSTNGSSLAAVQAARVGGGGLSATVSVDLPAVAELVQGGTRAPLLTVPIAEGSGTSPTSGPDVVALDGIAPGVVQVSAQVPGFTPTTNGTRIVTVGPAALSIIGDDVTTASGLRSPASRVRLNGSDHGGTDVTITVLDPSLVNVSADDGPGAGQIVGTIPDGETDLIFYLDGLEGQTGSTFFDVSAPGFDGAGGEVEVAPVAVTLVSLSSTQNTLDPFDVFYARIGFTTNGSSLTARAVRPGGTPVPVTFAVDDSTLAILRTESSQGSAITADVPPGATTTPTSLSLGGVALDALAAGDVTVSAGGPGLLPTTGATRVVTVSEPTISFVGGLPGTVGAGLVTATFRARLGASQHGGTTIRVESLDPSRALLSTSASDTGQAFVEGFVADGGTDLLFQVHGIEGTTGTVDIEVSADQFGSTTSTIDVVVPSIQLVSVSTTQDLAGSADAIYATVGLPSGSGVSAQARRPGAGPLEVTFALSDSTVARLVTQNSSGGTATALVPEGSSRTPTSLATEGVALDGLAPGVTVVTARATGFLPSPNADVEVTITTPSISFVGTSFAVGAGLQSSTGRVRLSGPNHGGTTVTLAPSAPLVLLTEDPEIAGTDTLTLEIPDGSIDGLFQVQALDDALGPVVLTAAAPGFVDETFDVEILAAAVEIVSLGSSFDVGDPLDAFYARIGIASESGASVATVQPRRAGASPVPVTVASNDALVAEIVGPGGTGASQVISIQPGSSRTPLSIATGGFALRPVGEGIALITASAPGYVTPGSGQRTVTVDAGGIAIAGVPFRLGGGLQTDLLTATLSDRFHGGVTLRIASRDSTRARVATDPSSPGVPQLEFDLPNGTGTATFVIQGVSGATGPAVVDASAGDEVGLTEVEIVEAALQFVGVPDSLNVPDGANPFVVQTGLASAEGDSLVQLQDVSAIGAPLLVSLVNTNPATGDLATSGSQGDSIVVGIDAGVFQSPPAVGDGGVAFVPQLAGSTTIRASAPGFGTAPTASVDLVVFGDLTDAPAVAVPFGMRPNVPNPFNPSTTLQFSLPQSGPVELVIFDVRGRRVRTLVDDERPAGVHTVEWTGLDDGGTRVASGVYFARLVAGGESVRRKMVMVQ